MNERDDMIERGVRVSGEGVDVRITVISDGGMQKTRFEVDGYCIENWVFPGTPHKERFQRDNALLYRETGVWLNGGAAPTPFYESGCEGLADAARI